MSSTRNSENLSQYSDESLDALEPGGGAKPSRVSKWRSSIRSGIKKSKKTTRNVSQQIKKAQDKALDTVQQKLPITSFGRNKGGTWSSEEGLNSYER